MAQRFPVIINSSNLVAGTTNQYRFSFPAGSVHFPKGSKIAISNISMYYSWFNITSAYNNNTFQIVFPTSTTPTTLNITIPDGFYSVSDLNSYLQQEFITAGLYLVDSNGDYVYYAEFLENPTSYAIQFNSYPVPTSLPATYTNPASMTFPLVATTPQLVVSSSNDFGLVIGFSAASYPSVVQSTTYSGLSDITPQISPVNSVITTCSLVNNRLNIPNTVLYSFNADVGFGSLIRSSPNEYAFIPISPGSYESLLITFLDQRYLALPMRDTEILVQLLVEVPE